MDLLHTMSTEYVRPQRPDPIPTPLVHSIARPNLVQTSQRPNSPVNATVCVASTVDQEQISGSTSHDVLDSTISDEQPDVLGMSRRRVVYIKDL